ncbi:MAG: hypothetical protein V1774_09460 [Candidatus Eisenbacteria bacterium]
MPEMRHRVEIMVTQGSLVVRHARCPNGCNLMDPEHLIHDHASIVVKATLGEQSGHIRLDPHYGSFENLSEIDVAHGEVVEFACPHCGASLQDPGRRCAQCSAPMFVLHLPKGGFIEVCQRNGCPNHRLQIVTGEQAMQRAFDELGMDAFL